MQGLLPQVRLICFAAFLFLLMPNPPVGAQQDSVWTAPQPLSPPSEHAWQPALCTDVSGSVHAVWYGRPADQGSEPEALLYSRYGAGEWTEPVDILVSPNGRSALYPRCVVDQVGRLHVVWSSTDVGSFGPLYHSWVPVDAARSAASWSPAVQVASGTFQSDVAMDRDGRLHLVYADVLGDAGICHISSADNGESWSSPSCIPRDYVVRDEEHEVKPRLAIDSLGTLHAVWVLHDYSSLSQLPYSGRAVYYARSTDGGATWADLVVVEEMESRAPRTETRQPEWIHVAVDRKERVHLVWVGSPDMYRYHQWSDDGGTSWHPRQVAIASGGYNGSMGLAVDGAGTLHLLAPSLQGLEYAAWRDGSWSPPHLFEDSQGAHYAQAVVALGNQLHTAWQDHGGNPKPSDQARVLHAMMMTEAEPQAPLPLPTSPALADLTPSISGQPEDLASAPPTAGPMIESLASQVEPPSSTSGSLSPLLIGLLPPLILVGLVLVLRARWSRG